MPTDPPASPGSPAGAVRRVASLTLGQSPRGDVVPDILAQLPMALEVQEFGALDGLSEREIAALAPRADEGSLVTRLRDGREVVLSRQRLAQRMEAICRAIDPARFDLLIVLTTGLFREFESECPTVNAQRAMDATIAALAAAGQAVGVIYPLRRQVDENAGYSVPGCALRFSHAAGGDAAGLRRAADELRGCDFVVLHSVGYVEADREAVAARTGRPVILARRVVAGAIRLLLDPGGSRRPPPPLVDERAGDGAAAATAARMQTLTPRERQVMSLVAEGLSNKAIGRQLDISPRTVEIHRARMMEKMGAASVGALIRMVLGVESPAS
ncbi:MAG: AroM family protein [Proteobacteria bacterium]|nr:AroM family protein [Pseudomonadota bacterium]